MTAASRWREGAAQQQRLLTGARPIGYGPVSGWVRVAGSSGPTGAMTAGRRSGRSEGGQDVRPSVPATLTQPMSGQHQEKGGSGLKALLHSYAGKTALASKTGPSTHTRFIAGPSAVSTRTAQPAQPPTAQAMYSSSETWQGMP